MIDKREITNAVIESAHIKFERGFILTVWISLDYGGSGQGFGGYVLGGDPNHDSKAARHHEQQNIAAEWIGQILSIGGVEDWNDLKGKVIRVDHEPFGKIYGIGHAIKDRWFYPGGHSMFGGREDT